MKTPSATELQKSMNALYELPEDVPVETQQKVNFLRQWLNEDRKCEPLVTNADIWHFLK